MGLEVNTIVIDVFTILTARKIPISNLGDYNISRGMNAKIIAEIIIYVYNLNLEATKSKQAPTISNLYVANISTEDLKTIYNNLTDKPEEDISHDALLALRLTLGRYWRILEKKN